jgi:hypothetical protein
MPYYVEMARRGFVVASIDIEGCGGSDNGLSDLTAGSLGMLACVEDLMSLPYVDEKNVAVTGHSYGNFGCLQTIAALNVEGSTQRIRGWVDGDGLRYLPKMTEEMANGLIMTVGAAKYGESTWPMGYDFLNNKSAKTLVTLFNSNFNGGTIQNGQWYSTNGAIKTPAVGSAIDANKAINVTQYIGTHPMWHFNTKAVRIGIDGFYAALGTPSGTAPIASNHQVWPFEVVFEFLGLIGFFMLMCPLAVLLLKAPFFADIKRRLPEREELPAFKDPRRWVTTVIALIGCAFFTFYSYSKLYPIASNVINEASYPSSSASVKALLLWNFVSGLFMIALIMVMYFVNRLMYHKQEDVKIPSPFASAELSSVTQFFKTLLYSAIIVTLMFIPVVIAKVVFHADFRICTFAVQFGDITWLYGIITKYVPMWLMFFIPGAVLNANMRFKDLPDWIGTLLIAMSNCVPLIIMIILQYTAMVSTGYKMPYSAAAVILAFSVIPVMAFSTYSSRFIYKKTGSAWAAGIINGAVLCIMMVYNGSWATAAIFF